MMDWMGDGLDGMVTTDFQFCHLGGFWGFLGGFGDGFGGYFCHQWGFNDYDKTL